MDEFTRTSSTRERLSLVTFLAARLDEDEVTAYACPFADWETSGPPPGHYAWSSTSTTLNGRYPNDRSRSAILANPTSRAGRSLDHAARHDPARVLAEVQAKRKTIARCQEEMFSGIPRLVHFAKQTLREMAEPYADHADYSLIEDPS